MQNIVTARWRGGYVSVTGGGGGRRRTHRIDAGNAETAENATSIAAAALEAIEQQTESITVTVGDSPSLPEPGDRISTFDHTGGLAPNRLIARRCAIDSNGVMSITPTLQTPTEQLDLRQQRAIKRMANGTDGGRFGGGAPLYGRLENNLLTGQLSAPSGPTFSWSPLDEYAAHEVPIETDLTLTVATFTFNNAYSPASTTTTPPSPLPSDLQFRLFLDGTLVTFFTIPVAVINASLDYRFLGNVSVPAGSKLLATCHEVGSATIDELDEWHATLSFTTAPGRMTRPDTITV